MARSKSKAKQLRRASTPAVDAEKERIQQEWRNLLTLRTTVVGGRQAKPGKAGYEIDVGEKFVDLVSASAGTGSAQRTRAKKAQHDVYECTWAAVPQTSAFLMSHRLRDQRIVPSGPTELQGYEWLTRRIELLVLEGQNGGHFVQRRRREYFFELVPIL
jgi:hypothetical protein